MKSHSLSRSLATATFACFVLACSTSACSASSDPASVDPALTGDASPHDADAKASDDSTPSTHDTGASKEDSATASKDTGSAPDDTGVAIDDTGSASSGDSGTGPTDSGHAPKDSGAAPSDAGAASASGKLVSHEVTFYGWPDNSPPGPAIAYPTIHSVAGGTGTYADPITFATDPKEFAPGTILYVPFIQKYVIMEDACAQCISDWSSGKRHIDIWMNSDNTHGSALLACQDHWTMSSTDVEESPPADRPVSAPPLFDTSTGVCTTGP